MTTNLSAHGEVALPDAVREQLGLTPGEPLLVAVENDRIILTRSKDLPASVCIVEDPATGLPLLRVSGATEKLTSRRVAEMMKNFP